jgi:hypothetical protein
MAFELVAINFNDATKFSPRSNVFQQFPSTRAKA